MAHGEKVAPIACVLERENKGEEKRDVDDEVLPNRALESFVKTRSERAKASQSGSCVYVCSVREERAVRRREAKEERRSRHESWLRQKKRHRQKGTWVRVWYENTQRKEGMDAATYSSLCVLRAQNGLQNTLSLILPLKRESG